MRMTSIAPMVFAVTVLAAGVSAVATGASASEPRMSDADYWQASHCLGLAKGLGDDTRALEAYLDRQSLLRDAFIADEGKDKTEAAARQAKRGGYGRFAAQQERDGACQAYLRAPATTGAGR